MFPFNKASEGERHVLVPCSAVIDVSKLLQGIPAPQARVG